MNNNTMVQQQQQEQISKINLLKEQFQELIKKREETYVSIGITLNKLKEEFKEEGKFMQWLETETRISYSSANRYMKVASAFKGTERWAVNLGVKKAYLLTKIEDSDERTEFMKKHQVSKKSYDEINTLLKDYLNKDKKETPTQKAINPKRAINKLKKTIDKEVDNYKLIIQEMGDETPIQVMDIKNKLSELQILLSDTDIKNPKIDKDDDVEAETPTTILDENDDKDDESSLYRYGESNEYYY